jgi:hypothetical protein
VVLTDISYPYRCEFHGKMAKRRSGYDDHTTAFQAADNGVNLFEA